MYYLQENNNSDNCRFFIKNYGGSGTSLVVQWLTQHAPNAGGLGLISLVRELDPTHHNERSCTPQEDQRSHGPQRRAGTAKKTSYGGQKEVTQHF